MHVLQGCLIEYHPSTPTTTHGRSCPSYLYRIDVSVGDESRDLILFFASMKNSQKWYDALQKGSGDFRFNYYYTIPKGALDEKMVGRAGRSFVFQGIHKSTFHEVAIKSISLRETDASEEAKIENEIHIMRMSVHNYVVRMLDSFKSFNEYLIVLEYESGGTLASYLDARNHLLKENRALEIGKKLAEGLEYMHE